MKAERTEPKQEFVPVIVTLESQEEVDSLYAVTNHLKVTGVLPALNHWWNELTPFASYRRDVLWEKLANRLREC